MEMSDFLESQGMTEEDYESECQQYAESKVEQNLIVQGIMDAEGLSINDEETQKLKDDLIEEYGFASIDEMIETYGEQEVERFIVENATVTEVAGDSEDAVDEGDDLEEYDKSMDIDTGDDTEDNVDIEDAAAEDATDEVAEE